MISFKFNGIQKTIVIKHLLVFINTTITLSVCALGIIRPNEAYISPQMYRRKGLKKG
jgi:hypothetical protein